MEYSELVYGKDISEYETNQIYNSSSLTNCTLLSQKVIFAKDWADKMEFPHAYKLNQQKLQKKSHLQSSYLVNKKTFWFHRDPQISNHTRYSESSKRKKYQERLLADTQNLTTTIK